MRKIILYESFKTIQYKDMKHWGEGNPPRIDPKIDKNYFDMVFADFIDKGCKSESYSNNYIIFIPFNINTGRNINELENDLKICNEIVLDIKSCISKIKEDHPDIEHFIILDKDDLSVELYYKQGYFYGED